MVIVMSDHGQDPSTIGNNPTAGLPFSTSANLLGGDIPIEQSSDETLFPEIDSSTSDSNLTASLSTIPIGSSGFLVTPDTPTATATAPDGSSTPPSSLPIDRSSGIRSNTIGSA